MIDNIKILECPFCGKSEYLEYDGIMSIVCNSCGCTGPDFMGNEIAAVEAWNVRYLKSCSGCKYDGKQGHPEYSEYSCDHCSRFMSDNYTT